MFGQFSSIAEVSIGQFISHAEVSDEHLAPLPDSLMLPMCPTVRWTL